MGWLALVLVGLLAFALAYVVVLLLEVHVLEDNLEALREELAHEKCAGPLVEHYEWRNGALVSHSARRRPH